MPLNSSAAILLVDDQPVSVAVTQSILTRLGYHSVDTTTSPAEALERIRTRRYEVVISYWHMPITDGPALFKQAKEAAGSRCPKFLFLTGDHRWGCMVTARDLGADGFVVKPPRPADLMERLSQSLYMM